MKSFEEHNAKDVTVSSDFMKAQSFKNIFTVKMYSGKDREGKNNNLESRVLSLDRSTFNLALKFQDHKTQKDMGITG